MKHSRIGCFALLHDAMKIRLWGEWNSLLGFLSIYACSDFFYYFLLFLFVCLFGFFVTQLIQKG